MTNEVRQARLADRLPGINFTEFAVLLIMADTCRGDSRTASISMAELEKLSGRERTSLWRAVNKLAGLRYIEKLSRGNHFQASRYVVLPDSRCTSATGTEGEHVALAQQAPGEHVALAQQAPGEHVALAQQAPGEHVALAQEHVALASSARCAGATYPSIPDIYPEGGLRKSGTSPDEAPADAPPPLIQEAGSGERLRCARHANIINDANVPRCLDCKRLRLSAEAAAKAQQEQRVAERERQAVEFERIQHCPDCRGGHWVLDECDMPLDPAVRCMHPKLQAPS
ncbi:hypothetical protein AAHS21_23675 [Mycobacterium sp. 050272]|uniref:hypothetical protein n=1 Tax=Mycobacterium sp. 050272 TaxID=3142488 RepID=UPI0031874752